MDKIILSSKDVEELLKWRDNNADLVRRNAAPFKGILLDFPETNINIKAYNDAGKIAFYVRINGSNVGKITGLQRPAGFLQVTNNTTKLNSDDVQSIITVYASLMAFVVYNEPSAATTKESSQERPKKAATRKKQPRKDGITYLFKHSSSGPRLHPRGHHSSPAGVFTVRGHYRRYKNGCTVWIKPYKKGEGTQKNKTYKL